MGDPKATILLIDDAPSNLRLLTEILEKHHYKVLVALSGERGLESLNQTQPDLILLDIMLPGMDGFEVCRRIKTNERLAPIPVLFISALNQTEDVLKGFDVGGADYVSKPFEELEVVARIKTLINLYQAQRQLSEKNRALEKATKLAESALEARSNFIASMSHDLRTPLTAIIGSIEMLMDDCAACSGNDKYGLIQSVGVASRNQLALVNDILDMSKLEAGKFEINREPYDLKLLLDELYQMLEIRAKDNGVDLRISHQGIFPLLVGDNQRITQILTNLVGNAIKFSEGGAVEVTVVKEGDQLSIAVCDNGIGMSSSTVNKLFQPYEQGDSDISSRFGGTGLGLYISKQLAELMGGDISVQSREGEGSLFTLTLPYQLANVNRVNQSQAVGQTTAAQLQPLEGHVLIAEDTRELQMLEQRILERMGLQVTVCSNGEEAVQLATTQPFGAILMDMQMPVMDGVEATRVLREQGIETPVIALTANVMKKHRDQFVEAGCNGFVGKPIDNAELRRMLSQYL